MAILITRHLPQNLAERSRVLSRFSSHFESLEVISEEDVRTAPEMDEEENLCDLLLQLACSSTPSCIDAVIPAKLLDDYDRMNEAYAKKVGEVLAATGAGARRSAIDFVIMNHDFFLLPRKIRKYCPTANIVYHVGNLMPVSELFMIVPFSAELLKGLLGANKIVFGGFRAKTSFESCLTRHLAVIVEKDVIPRCNLTDGRKVRLTLNAYRPDCIDDGSCEDFFTPTDRTVLVNIEFALSSVHSLILRMHAFKDLISSGHLAKAAVVLVEEQSFGSSFPLTRLRSVDKRVKRLVKYAAEMNQVLDPSGATNPLELRVVATEQECTPIVAQAAVLLLGEPYAVGCRFLKQYLQSRVAASQLNPPLTAVNGTPRVVVSNTSESARLCIAAGWPGCNPFSKSDVEEKVIAVLQTPNPSAFRARRSLRQFESYQNSHWIANIASACTRDGSRTGSIQQFRFYQPESLIEAFLIQRPGEQKIVISEVEGVFGPAEVTVANRCILPPVVLQWSGLAPDCGHSSPAASTVDNMWVDLYLTSRLSVEALADVVGCPNISVDADFGHYHKELGAHDFKWVSEVDPEELSKSFFGPLEELMTYYKDRTPGSYIVRSVSSMSFHVQDCVKKTNILALHDLTTHIQSGIVPHDHSLELTVFPRSVLVATSSRERFTTLVNGVTKLKATRHAGGGQSDILGIGSPSFLEHLKHLYPEALTICSWLEPSSDPRFDYTLGSMGEALSLLQGLKLANAIGRQAYLRYGGRLLKQPLVGRPRAARRDDRLHNPNFTYTAVGCTDDYQDNGSGEDEESSSDSAFETPCESM